MAVHKLIGGQRVIDTLGPDDEEHPMERPVLRRRGALNMLGAGFLACGWAGLAS
jgi:hypothetical protein